MCYFWVGATATLAENLGQGEALQWQVIQWAKGAGCEWYDLVGVDREHLPHIATFKLGFTRQIVTFQRVYYATVFSRALQRLEHSLWRHH
jgi:lipid II:glycine glycyltransferase (peptidoglycan interpeptide bridge formation enzyme)